MTDTLTDIASGPVPPARPPRRRRWRRYLAVVLAVAMIYPVVTYLRALTYPGNASVAVRTVDWLRDDMGAGPLVNSIENWWFTRHKPSDGPPAASAVPRVGAPVVAPPGPRPQNLPAHGGFPLPGEGMWRPVDRQGGLYTTYFRPDAAHGSVLAGAAWFNQHLVTARQIAGTKEPVADPGTPGRVPDSLRPRLLATFNSGFKTVDANGGSYLAGSTLVPLRDGAASVVIHRDGQVTVGRWGRDARMSGDIVSVQQSLDLVVDGGKVVRGLDVNRDARWGSARSQFQYTWRSGLGTDAGGHLIYVAGNDLTLATLASAMREAGIVRGMQLDIHTDMVSFNAYPTPEGIPHQLLPAMASPPERYLSTDLRSFFVIAERTIPVQETP
jgi:hypothetical protein